MSTGEAARDTPPARTVLETAFRATFLWCFTEPEHLELLRQLGRVLYDIAMESPYWDWGASHGLSSPRGDATAAAADLEDLAAYLQRIAGQPAELGVAREDLGVCRAAAGWAGRVRRPVAEMREAVEEDEEDGESE
jgi:hypothetical protein